MQGNVTRKTVAPFTPVFFAGAPARWAGGSGHGRGPRHGARPPRLVDAGAVYAPQERAHRLQARLWRRTGGPAQVARAANNIKAGRCTPILGSGLTEWLLGSRGRSPRWAETFGYPMDPNSRESLPQVAQYLAVDQDVAFMRDELDQVSANGDLPALRRPAAGRPQEIGLDEPSAQWAPSWRPAPHPDLSHAGQPAAADLHHHQPQQPAGRCAGSRRARQPVVELCRWNDD